MAERQIAETFPPGDFIREELEARGWSQDDLANVLGCSLRLVNEVIAGKRGLTPETAAGLGEAFGTGAQVWLNLESAYRLSRLGPTGDAVARRARLYGKAPIKELLKRHWIEPSESLDVLEHRVMGFFGLPSLDEEIRPLAHAARKAAPYTVPMTPAQCAWLLRVRQLARALTVARFSKESLDRLREVLSELRGDAADIPRIPRLLADAGVRMVIVEPLAGTKIDGACVWLDPRSPVVAISSRFDRIDWFWFTLMHELAHVGQGPSAGDGAQIDMNLVGADADLTEGKPPLEREADEAAAAFLVPSKDLEHFIIRTRPLYSRAKIEGFARRIRVHTGLVVGQLQRRSEIPYSHSRDALVKVRHLITQTALTDGWDRPLPASLGQESRS